MKHDATHLQSMVNTQGQYLPQGHGVEVYVDSNRDAITDTVIHHGSDSRTLEVIDTDYNGQFDMVIDHGSSFDHSVTVYLDTDGDGIMDVLQEDTNGDGVWDRMLSDVDGDGNFE